MQVLADQQRLVTNGVDSCKELLVVAVLDKLLHEVVAKGVEHEVRKLANCHLKDYFEQVRSLNLRLQKATTCLVFGKHE